MAFKKPHRSLESLVIPGPDRELSPIPVQLSAFILRKYLTNHSLDVDFQGLKDFMQGVFVEIVKNLEHLVKEQKKIKS